MDNISVFEIDSDVKVIVTVGELQMIYFRGYGDGLKDSYERDPVIVKGEIV